MQERRAVFEAVVSDLRLLRETYARAGLLGPDAARDQRLRPMIGSEGIDSFQRDFFLFDALVRNRVAVLVYPRGRQRHVAVFGANNVGKSSVINLLLGEGVAATSVEGGFTRHAQAFAATPPPFFGDNPHPFEGFACLPVSQLSDARFDAWGFATLPRGALGGEIVLWDTPDCDSVGASRYLRSVLEALAAADLVLYVTTPDRYAQERPVAWLFQIMAAGLPVVECLNKTLPEIFDRVVARQAVLFDEMVEGATPDFPILRIGALCEAADGDLWGRDNPEVAALRQALAGALARVDDGAAAVLALDYLNARVSGILRPVRIETSAQQGWADEVGRAVADFSASYEKGYLTSDKAIDPFTRLNLEILQLLDPNIPGLKQTMTALRWVTRWPARLLLIAGRRIFSLALAQGRPPAAAQLPPELKVYADAHAAVLSRLAERITTERAATPHHPFWDALDQEFVSELKDLSATFSAAAEQHMAATDATIKIAAAEIYDRLRTQPVMLNALRAVRVTANAAGALAGFIVPVKGGIAFDLLEEGVLAPLLISATEGAAAHMVESYVGDRRRKIVATLRDDARSMAETIYRRRLLGLARSAMARTRALSLDDGILERLPANLERLRAARPDDMK